MYVAAGQGETTLEDNFLMEAERTYLFDRWLHVSKISSTSDFMHIFYDFIHVYSPGTRADNPLGTKF